MKPPNTLNGHAHLPRTWRGVVAVALCAGGLLTGTTAGASAASRLDVALAADSDVGVVVPTKVPATFDVTLTPKNPQALASFIFDISNPASPLYHRYLTPSEFSAKFGARAAASAAVTSYLEGDGLHVSSISTSGLLLKVTGSERAVTKAFNAPVASERIKGGKTVALLRGVGSWPRAIATNVTSVTGLSSVEKATSSLDSPHSSEAGGGPAACPGALDGAATTSTTVNGLYGYTLAQQATTYGLTAEYNSGDTGLGETIAMFELGQYDPRDVSTYFQCYGLSNQLTATAVDGGAMPGPYSEEATMDIQEAAGLAPGAAIAVYTGPNNSTTGALDVYQKIADDDSAQIVSTSWGICEAEDLGEQNAEALVFEQMAAQGQTVYAAAGDQGAFDCGANSAGVYGSTAVDDPGSQPYVTSVGGLSISSAAVNSSSVWNSDGGAGGGGVSSFWAKPSWQEAPGVTTDDTMRMVPDLSVMADPNDGFLDYFTGVTHGYCPRYCSGGWSSVGGTSIGAPLMSAMTAVAAQACGTRNLGFLNPTFYAMDSATAGTTDPDFFDVTTGSNDLSDPTGGTYSAGAGYDMASGLGSPNGAGFLAGLCLDGRTGVSGSLTPTTAGAEVGEGGATFSLSLSGAEGAPISQGDVDIAVKGQGAVSVSASGTAVTTAVSTPGGRSATVSTTTTPLGTATLHVTTDTPGNVTISGSYLGTTIFSLTQAFGAPVVTVAKVGKRQPGAPTITSIVPGTTTLIVHLRAPASDGGSRITSYEYLLSTSVLWQKLSSGGHRGTITNLLKDHAYSLVVRAVNAKGAGPVSAAVATGTLAT
jgi:subtilase family serine protease